MKGVEVDKVTVKDEETGESEERTEELVKSGDKS